MSAATPLRRPAPVRMPVATAPASPAPARSPRPRLVLVSQHRPTAGRLPFLIVVGSFLVAGLVGVLLLHTIAAQDAFRANALQQRVATLTDQEQQLAGVVEADSAPGALRQRAASLGMVPTTVNSFRKLHDGRTVGVQTPVYVPPPTPTVTHSAKSSSGTTAKPGTNANAKGKGKSTGTGTTKHTRATHGAGTNKTGTTNKPGTTKQTGTTKTAGTSGPKHHDHPAQP